MNLLYSFFFVCSLCSLVWAQSDQTVAGTKNPSDCSFDDVCKNVHQLHTVINNKIYCCLNGHLPSVQIINTAMSCSCDPAKTMTPEELEHTLENTFANLFG